MKNAFLQAHVSIIPERNELKETMQRHLHGDYIMWNIHCNVHDVL